MCARRLLQWILLATSTCKAVQPDSEKSSLQPQSLAELIYSQLEEDGGRLRRDDRSPLLTELVPGASSSKSSVSKEIPHLRLFPSIIDDAFAPVLLKGLHQIPGAENALLDSVSKEHKIIRWPGNMASVFIDRMSPIYRFRLLAKPLLQGSLNFEISKIYSGSKLERGESYDFLHSKISGTTKQMIHVQTAKYFEQAWAHPAVPLINDLLQKAGSDISAIEQITLEYHAALYLVCYSHLTAGELDKVVVTRESRMVLVADPVSLLIQFADSSVVPITTDHGPSAMMYFQSQSLSKIYEGLQGLFFPTLFEHDGHDDRMSRIQFIRKTLQVNDEQAFIRNTCAIPKAANKVLLEITTAPVNTNFYHYEITDGKGEKMLSYQREPYKITDLHQLSKVNDQLGKCAGRVVPQTAFKSSDVSMAGQISPDTPPAVRAELLKAQPTAHSVEGHCVEFPLLGLHQITWQK